MDDSEWHDCKDTQCRKCYEPTIQVRIVTASDGGHEDYNYRCTNCKANWWIDGIDS